MADIDFEIDTASLDQLVLDFVATDTEVRRALASTLSKMGAWLRAQSVRGLSTALEVPQTVVRKRLRAFRVSQRGDSARVRVWYGLNPMAMIDLRARQQRHGVRAGRHFRESAFIADGRNRNRQVFKRREKARLPIDKQMLDIEDKATTYIEDQLVGGPEFDRRFLKTFEHELEWRTRKRK